MRKWTRKSREMIDPATQPKKVKYDDPLYSRFR